MKTLVLLRHGRSTANTAGILAGRSDGVDLDEVGREQASALADRLAEVGITGIVSSPLTRCQQTVAPLAARLGLPVTLDPELAEVDYGSWTGRSLADLAKEDLWRIVQATPSAVVFPEGEGLAEMSARAVAAVRRQLEAADGPLLVCSHGDVIKAILADALGLHLDGFQRIVVGTASVSVIRYAPGRPFVEKVNDTGEIGVLAAPSTAPDPGAESSDATVGGSVR
ncbi:MSMEG_4193 family putative phosphomutase [Nakamurella silvestris]|nr:MSMEG_4193 family putative phosphomutase [Nakamurella silvestris]